MRYKYRCSEQNTLKAKAGNIHQLGKERETDETKVIFEDRGSVDTVEVTKLPPWKEEIINGTSKTVVIIDDNFPVWALSLAVSSAVIIAVGIILFFY